MTNSRDSASRPEGEAAKPAAQPQGGGNPVAPVPGEGTEPRSGERLGHPTSQGLAGAQGSGGGADRGIQQAPTRPNNQAQRSTGTPGARPAGADDASGDEGGRR
ncbi:hypothetical protein [Caldimonas tepidiphila]|uniref:hypothetical protein n=1 Tax=Caldimonas tepidiphila TaxID=2315841 RepID=UPI000E5B2FE2|nr:hypothetical protein [Caldimonas tepidiphila]